MTHVEFKQLYEEEHWKMIVFAKRMLKSVQAAEDVVADSFVAVFDKGSVTGDVTDYLWKTMINKVSNIKKHERRKSDKHDELKDDLNEIVEAESVRTELLSLLRSEMLKQPKSRQKVMRLYLEGFEKRDIQQLTGLAPGTICVHRDRFIQHMKAVLGLCR